MPFHFSQQAAVLHIPQYCRLHSVTAHDGMACEKIHSEVIC